MLIWQVGGFASSWCAVCVVFQTRRPLGCCAGCDDAGSALVSPAEGTLLWVWRVKGTVVSGSPYIQCIHPYAWKSVQRAPEACGAFKKTRAGRFECGDD